MKWNFVLANHRLTWLKVVACGPVSVDGNENDTAGALNSAKMWPN